MDIYEEGYDYHGDWDEDAMQDIAMNERDAALWEENQLKKKPLTSGKNSGEKVILRTDNISEV